MYFVGFYSVPNLIIILFNLVYPVFIMGCDCKGCVLERESVKAQASEARRILAGVSQEDLTYEILARHSCLHLYRLFAFQSCVRHMLHFGQVFHMFMHYLTYMCSVCTLSV